MLLGNPNILGHNIIPYKVVFSRYLNSTNFVDVGRFVKLKISKKEKYTKYIPFGKDICENKNAKKLGICGI